MAALAPIEVSVVDAANAEVGKLKLPDLFAGPVNDALLFDQVLAQRAGQRAGEAATKTRGKVRGGGAKPWRQKGTGRARAGSNRSPLWRGGGTTFGPSPRSYGYRLPGKARLGALRSALAQKARDGQLRVIEGLGIETPKTQEMRKLLERLEVPSSAMVVTALADKAVVLSARNLPGVLATCVAGLNVYDLLRHEVLLVTREAVAAIEERFRR